MIIDVHVHLWDVNRKRGGLIGEKAERWNQSVFRSAKHFGIDRLCCFVTSDVILPGVEERPEVEEFMADNRALVEYMHQYPALVLGFAYLNPCFPEASAKELETCVNEFGMVGVKLLRSVRCNDPRLDPIAETAGALKVPILQHAGTVPGPARANRLGESTTEDLIELGERFPQTTFIFAHLAGGGDWEWEVKALKGHENLYVDMSGSVQQMGMVEMAVEELGAEKLLFGTDGSVCASLGRIYGAEITEEERRWILGENMARILRQRGVAL